MGFNELEKSKSVQREDVLYIRDQEQANESWRGEAREDYIKH